MKVITLLLMSFFLLVDPVEKPKYEWAVGVCGAQSFTVAHMAVSEDGKKLIFDYYLSAPGVVEKDKNPLILDYKETKVTDDEITIFEATGKNEQGTPIKVTAGFKGNRVVGVLAVGPKGELGAWLYGVKGTVDSLVLHNDEDLELCKVFHAIPEDDAMQLLKEFLLRDEAGLRQIQK